MTTVARMIDDIVRRLASLERKSERYEGNDANTTQRIANLEVGLDSLRTEVELSRRLIINPDQYDGGSHPPQLNN